MSRSKWPAAVYGTTVFLIIFLSIASAIAWTVVLPTVGFLYFLGVLA